MVVGTAVVGTADGTAAVEEGTAAAAAVLASLLHQGLKHSAAGAGGCHRERVLDPHMHYNWDKKECQHLDRWVCLLHSLVVGTFGVGCKVNVAEFEGVEGAKSLGFVIEEEEAAWRCKGRRPIGSFELGQLICQ